MCVDLPWRGFLRLCLILTLVMAVLVAIPLLLTPAPDCALSPYDPGTGHLITFAAISRDIHQQRLRCPMSADAVTAPIAHN